MASLGLMRLNRRGWCCRSYCWRGSCRRWNLLRSRSRSRSRSRWWWWGSSFRLRLSFGGWRRFLLTRDLSLQSLKDRLWYFDNSRRLIFYDSQISGALICSHLEINFLLQNLPLMRVNLATSENNESVKKYVKKVFLLENWFSSFIPETFEEFPFESKMAAAFKTVRYCSSQSTTSQTSNVVFVCSFSYGE